MVRDAVRAGVGAGRLPISLGEPRSGYWHAGASGEVDGPDIALWTLYPSRGLLSRRVSSSCALWQRHFPCSIRRVGILHERLRKQAPDEIAHSSTEEFEFSPQWCAPTRSNRPQSRRGKHRIADINSAMAFAVQVLQCRSAGSCQCRRVRSRVHVG
jgi:hypothetical protein